MLIITLKDYYYFISFQKFSCGLNEQASSKAPEEVSTEQPSQIPVLDASVYQAVPILPTEGFLNEVGGKNLVGCVLLPFTLI